MNKYELVVNNWAIVIDWYLEYVSCKEPDGLIKFSILHLQRHQFQWPQISQRQRIWTSDNVTNFVSVHIALLTEQRFFKW